MASKQTTGTALEEIKKGTAITTANIGADLLAEDAAEGNNVSSRDMTVPFVRILQDMSPVTKKQKPEYIEGAESGMLINTLDNKLFDGAKGLYVIPVAYTRNNIEWKPNQGGFVKDHGDDDGIFDHCTRNDKGRDINNAGNEIVATGTHFCYLLDVTFDADGKPVFSGDYQPVVIAMASTQLKKSKKWNTMISLVKVDVGGRKISPASFYKVYKLTTVMEGNEQGDWFGWKIEEFGNTLELPGGEQMYLDAREFRKMITEGAVKTQEPQADIRDDVPGGRGDNGNF